MHQLRHAAANTRGPCGGGSHEGLLPPLRDAERRAQELRGRARGNGGVPRANARPRRTGRARDREADDGEAAGVELAVVSELAAAARRRLTEHVDFAYRTKLQRIVPGVRAIGVRLPRLRALARELAAGI